MRWTPSIVPNGPDQTTYLVIDGFDRGERLYRETPLDHADLETVIQDLIEGQYNDPYRVVAFITEEKWSADVSEDIAREIQKRCNLQFTDVPSSIEDFVNRYAVRDRQLALRLA